MNLLTQWAARARDVFLTCGNHFEAFKALIVFMRHPLQFHTNSIPHYSQMVIRTFPTLLLNKQNQLLQYYVFLSMLKLLLTLIVYNSVAFYADMKKINIYIYISTEI